MVRDVYVAGVGMTRFQKRTDLTIEDMSREAVLAALDDVGPNVVIDEAFCGSVFGGSLIGQRILRDLGLTGIPITNVENACSSGSSALREGVAAVALGRADTVLVIGTETLSQFGGGTLPLEASDLENAMGMVMPGLYAMRAQRYMHEYGATDVDLAGVVVKARRHAAANPYSQLRTPVTVEQVLQSRMIADPLRLFMCCPTGDGAAALVLATAERVRRWCAVPIRVGASVLQSGLHKTGFRDMAYSELTARTARLAYEQAGVGPEDVDVAELHDAFASAELMYYEALGFCERGAGPRLLRDGETTLTGRIPVNPSGGLLSRGHPIGATGVAQVCEAVWQLRGQAGDRQVPAATVALTHCTGGGISGLDHGACSLHILVR
jgi:benzoylsuccinyl-CoA thiolase BbsB subunit